MYFSQRRAKSRLGTRLPTDNATLNDGEIPSQAAALLYKTRAKLLPSRIEPAKVESVTSWAGQSENGPYH